MRGLVRFAVSWLAASLYVAPSVAQEIVLPQSFDPEVEQAEAAFPGIFEFIERPQGRALLAVDRAQVAELYRRLAEEPFSPDTRAALRVILQAYSRYIGAPATEGRQIMASAAGIAAASGDRSTLRGVAALLEELAGEPDNAYALAATELLVEKVRCGAYAQDDHELARILDRPVPVDHPFKAPHDDRDVADRFGLHGAADLYAVDARGSRVVAVGDFGTVLVSEDAGRTWRTPATGTDRTLWAVALSPRGEIWGVGRAGAVVFSRDAGRSVELRPTPFARHLFGVFAPAPQHALAVGDFGLQLVTEDSGRSWSCLPREDDVILGRIAAAGGDAVMVGEFATVERLASGSPPGRPGRIVDSPEDLYLYDVWADERGDTAVAVGPEGTILRSRDGGALWSPVHTDFDADLYGVGGHRQRVVVVGEEGFIAVSTDGGLHFEPVPTPRLPLPYHDVALGGSDRAYLVGRRGSVVALSADGTLEPLHPKGVGP